MLCSILLPTRSRPERLRETVESFYAHGEFGKFEMLLAIDFDDDASFAATSLLADEFPDLKVFRGERRSGWPDLNIRYTELAKQSSAPWVWMMNDDCLVHGNWISALKGCPSGLVHPEIYRIGQSVYRHDATGGFPIVPNGVWREYGYPGIQHPPDTFLNDLCREQRLPFSFMAGVEISHQRKVDGILPPERL
jgi:GT2 family glycosyltransferase